MSRVLSRTLRGRAALDAFRAWLAAGGHLATSNRRTPDDDANYEAVTAFLTDLAQRGAKRVWLEQLSWHEQQPSLPLRSARFRPKQGDPDTDGDEGTAGFGAHRISLDGLRARITAPGILEMADRWGDSVAFATSSDADFSRTEEK